MRCGLNRSYSFPSVPAPELAVIVRAGQNAWCTHKRMHQVGNVSTHSLSNVLLKNYELAANRVAAAAAEAEDAADAAALADNQNQ
jgi:hypothetical protein